MNMKSSVPMASYKACLVFPITLGVWCCILYKHFTPKNISDLIYVDKWII